MNSRYRVKQWATFARTWWLYDANYQCPFESAEKVIPYLQGKHKPIYHPLSDIGDHVVVINTKHIAMPGEKWRTFKFTKHSGYPKKWGGFVQKRAWQLHKEDLTEVLRKFVYARIPGNLSRRTMMARLHLYPENEIPEDILGNITDQIKQCQPKPKRLDEYTQQEVENFPKLFDWPEDHITNLGQWKNR